MNFHDNVSAFENEIRSHGWDPGIVQVDGRWHRFDTVKRKDNAGRYRVFSSGDFVAGCIWDWKSDFIRTWNSGNGTGSGLSEAEKKKIDAAIEQSRNDAKRRTQYAQNRAKHFWDKSKPADPDHPYLLKKGIQPHTIRQFKKTLVTSIMTPEKEVKSIQFITGNGDKRFLKDGKIKGNLFWIKGDDTLCLGEGVATGVSIHEATGHTALIAFNSGNLAEVAEKIRAKYPNRLLIICGDDDRWRTKQDGTLQNIGREKALSTAWQYNCQVVMPMFPPGIGTKPTDFNDLASISGLDAVKDQIAGAVYPQEFLLRELQTDPGACYRPEHLAGLHTFMQRDKAAYMAFRSQLKKLKIGITELEKDIKGSGQSGGGATDHLSLAREIVAEHGEGNLIGSQAFIWKWDSSKGLWRALNDREIKQAIHSKIRKALEDPTKSIVDSVLDLLKTEIFKPDHKWDADETTINCLNGELFWDGSGWDLQPHCREHYRTTRIPVSYDPEATAPRFEKFLEEVFQDDPDKDSKQVLICEIIGYTLLSTARYEKFILLIGPGANGKSVLLEVVVSLVGAENTAAVQPSKFDSAFQRAHLHLKLLNAVSELAVGEEIKDDKMKSIASGELITCEHKFKNPFDLKPYCTIWMGSNHMPHTRDFSDALFRRAIVIQFNRVFAEKEQDKALKDKLKAELPGILNLALEGIAGVFKRGFFTEPESCKDAKREWRLNCDQAAEFVQDRCLLIPGSSIESSRLYIAYKDWSEDAGIKKALNRNNFTTRLCNLGIHKRKGTGGVRMLDGVKLF